MSKFWIVSIVALSFSLNTYALNLKQIKEKLRPFSQKYLGQETTEKFLGVSEDKIKLPKIPEIINDSKSTYTLSEDSVLAKQGSEYKQLSLEQKRPYRIAYLEELFEATRKQNVDDDELKGWLNTMEQGSSREGVYRAMVLDRVYSSLEQFEDAPVLDAVEFTKNFYQRFINRPVSVDALRKLNIYSIKKVVTDKCLDIMESFESRPEDLYKWYALLSKDLAQKFNYKNKLRDNTDSMIHYDWAKNVPYQHIKAELIIKIHSGYNSYLR